MKLEELEQETVHDVNSAVDYIESDRNKEPITKAQVIIAWAFLIRERKINNLTKWYKRHSTMIIEKGVIDEDGVIDWNVFRDVYEGRKR